MKSFLAALGMVLPAAVAVAGTASQEPPTRGVREAVQQYRNGNVPPPPRQLSDDARAQLRRQLSDHGRRR